MMTYPMLMILMGLVPAALALKTITVKNECKGTIWPAIKGSGPTKLDGTPQPYGWKQATGQAVSFQVPETWGPENRIWARTGCADNGSNCKIGACASDSLLCTGMEIGQDGATLAEFNIQAGTASYDVSMVAGFNLPMEITNTAGCLTGSCGVGAGHDILTMCDSRLAHPPGSDVVWSCLSACNKGKALSPSFDWDNSQWCCRSNAQSMQETCLKESQPWYKQYKPHCQHAYVYPADDNAANPAPVFDCDKGDFTITLCPGGEGSGTNPTFKAVTLDPGVSLHAKRRLETESK